LSLAAPSSNRTIGFDYVRHFFHCQEALIQWNQILLQDGPRKRLDGVFSNFLSSFGLCLLPTELAAPPPPHIASLSLSLYRSSCDPLSLPPTWQDFCINE
jgi:hypothetical protein